MRDHLAAIVAAIALAVAAAAGTGTLIDHGQAQQQAAADHRQMRALRSQVAALSTQVGSLGSQVSAISQPSDPLSAYNQICNQPFTDSQTGNQATYYFPCTNSAQTIPQPGQ